jgi:hypothetical protein
MIVFRDTGKKVSVLEQMEHPKENDTPRRSMAIYRAHQYGLKMGEVEGSRW